MDGQVKQAQDTEIGQECLFDGGEDKVDMRDLQVTWQHALLVVLLYIHTITWQTHRCRWTVISHEMDKSIFMCKAIII